MELKVKNSIIAIEKGDLLALPVEVIVSPTTQDMWMGKGVSAEIIARGGEDIHTEAKKSGEGQFGDIISTHAGKLAFKYIYHAVVVPRDLQINRKNMSTAVTNALARADKDGIKSIGFPMLGSATVKVPYDTYAGVMLRTAIEYFVNGDSKIEKVYFCLFNDECFDSFKHQLHVLRQEFFI